MIVAGLAAAGVLALPGLLPAVAAVLLIQLQILLDCSDGELARWRGGSRPRRLPRPDRPLAHRGGAADRARHPRRGADPRRWSAAVLVLLIKGESALVTVARAEAGLPLAADTQAVAAPRPSGLRRHPAGARRAAVLPRVRGDGVHAARAGGGDRGRGGRRPDRLARARDRAGRRDGDHRARATWSRSSPPTGCDDRLRRAHPGPPAGRAGGGARLAGRPARRRARRRRGRQRLGAGRVCRRACGGRAGGGPRDPRPGATPASARSTASCCSSSTTTPRLAAPDALARVAARFAADPGLGLLQLRVRAPTAGRRRATGCRGCASATRPAPAR